MNNDKNTIKDTFKYLRENDGYTLECVSDVYKINGRVCACLFRAVRHYRHTFGAGYNSMEWKIDIAKIQYKDEIPNFRPCNLKGKSFAKKADLISFMKNSGCFNKALSEMGYKF